MRMKSVPEGQTSFRVPDAFLTIPVAILAMRLAERTLEKPAATLK